METNSDQMPGAERDDDSGKYTDKYPQEEFLDALDEEGGMAATMDIASRVAPEYDRDPEEFYDTTYKKLRRLNNDGVIETREVGRNILWMLPDDAQSN